MRWEDESYVRLYKRETPEWTLLCWQARVVHPLILKNLDRAGLLELGRSRWKALASALRAPLKLIETAMEGTEEEAGLLADGCLKLIPDGKGGELLYAPNFLEAQEAKQSDAARKRAERERASAKARAASLGLSQSEPDQATVTKPDASVTNRDASVTKPDAPVTSCHNLSLCAVLTSAVQTQPDPRSLEGLAEELKASSKPESGGISPQPRGSTDPDPDTFSLAPPAPKPTKDEIRRAQIEDVLTHWVSQPYHKGRVKLTSDRRARVGARLDEGFSTDDLKLAIDGAALDPWLMGTAQNSTKAFKDVDTILRDAGQVERLREKGHEVRRRRDLEAARSNETDLDRLVKLLPPWAPDPRQGKPVTSEQLERYKQFARKSFDDMLSGTFLGVA